MTKTDKRAVKIVELLEELEEAKKIISNLVWPPDATTEQHQAFIVRAAHFAGCSIPQYNSSGEQDERVG